MTIEMWIDIDIEEMKNIRDIDIEKRDLSRRMFVIIAGDWDIGPMNVRSQKSLSKL